MLGTIEEIEKSIEEFQNNVAASGELVQLLRQLLEQIKQQNKEFDSKSQNYIEQLQTQEKTFSEKTQTLVAKVESVLAAIEAENVKSNGVIRGDIISAKESAEKSFDAILKMRSEEFAKEQAEYVSSLKETQECIKKCEEQLSAKYKEFNDSLERMNISNLYVQNEQMKKTLNTRTLILMIISGLSVVAAVAGLFM